MRFAWTMRLRPGCAETYVERHRAIWPEMRETLTRAGYRNYTIFQQEDLLFGYFECDDFGSLRRFLDQDETAARWRRSMADLVYNAPDPATGFPRLMTEVFRHDGGEG